MCGLGISAWGISSMRVEQELTKLDNQFLFLIEQQWTQMHFISTVKIPECSTTI